MARKAKQDFILLWNSTDSNAGDLAFIPTDPHTLEAVSGEPVFYLCGKSNRTTNDIRAGLVT